ncbi:hypothetical protein [Methanobrevibacter sp. V14]|mgnify:CR=1 FL=1|uniref:hypothetical protein n=1 Tax=Methanobrevibacter sp. V14 TaxID=3064280 RepID=UPI0027347FC3|nr:hypothetical protein [Methanobrevibacter sp. V14]
MLKIFIKNKISENVFVFIILFVILAISISGVDAASHHINNDGNFSNIQYEVDNAGSGDTIYLHNHTFVNSHSTPINIHKSITIDGGNYEGDNHKSTLNAKLLSRIFNVNSGVTLRLKNLNLINGKSVNGGAAYISGGSTLYSKDCNFINNSASIDGGVIYGGSSTTVTVKTNNNFINNSAGRDGGALFYTVISNVFKGKPIEYINFYNNKANHAGGALYFIMYGDIKTASDFRIWFNTVNNNTAMYGGGLYISLPDQKPNHNTMHFRGNYYFNNHATWWRIIYK